MLEPSQDPAVDLALVRAALAGDSVARSAVADRLQTCVPRILTGLNARLRRPLDEHSLADVAQDSLLTAWRRLCDYAGLGVLAAWVYSICSYQLMNAIRSRDKTARLDPLLEHTATDEAAARQWRQMLARETLERALARIGGAEADAVRLRHLEGLSFQEAATRLQLSVTACKARYYRAMVRVEQLLTDAGEAGGGG